MKPISTDAVQKFNQTAGLRNEIDQIMSPVLLAQGIYGQQILDPSWTWKGNALNNIVILSLVIYVIIGTIEFMQRTTDILVLSEAVFTFLILLAYITKVFIWLHYRATIREVYVMSKTTLFDIVKDILPKRSVELLELAREVIKVLFVLVILPTAAYVLGAIWNYCNGARVTLSRTTSTLMPMTAPYFEIGLLLHLIFFITVAFGTLVIDFWIIFFMSLFCEVSQCAVKILQVDPAEKKKETYESILNEALGKFYSVHVTLMEYLRILNVIFKWPFQMTLFMVLTCTSLSLFMVTEESNWQIAAVMLPTTTECFVYNTLGERIKTQAENMKVALLEFDWTSMKLKDRKSYCIITSYTNKDCGVYTAVGADLSYFTLSSIYKASYQIFAVLNTMKS